MLLCKTNVCGYFKAIIDTFVLVELSIAFGQVLKAHRKNAGYSQEELAHRAGMHSTAISLYERGRRQPTLYTVFNISHVLGIQPSSLVAELEALGVDMC